jgi:hypothetical protein
VQQIETDELEWIPGRFFLENAFEGKEIHFEKRIPLERIGKTKVQVQPDKLSPATDTPVIQLMNFDFQKRNPKNNLHKFHGQAVTASLNDAIREVQVGKSSKK